MASGASARTLFSLVVFAALALLVLAAPAGAAVGPRCAGVVATVGGTPGNDTLTGTEGDDVIRAGDGDDTINALGGDDVICAGPGDDTTSAGAGNDRVRSGSGNDDSNGDDGDDDMRGQGNNDVADGGTGVDRCLFESHQNCEADLDLTMTGPATASTGGLSTSVYNASLANHGPTPAVNTRVDLTLPAATLFVPGLSDPRCSATSATTVRCAIGPMGIDLPDATNLSIAFTNCNASSAVIAGIAEDPGTNDHVPANNGASVSTALSAAASCLPTAVNDAAVVGHDSAANAIDVLANDISGGLTFSVGSATNGAHGTVAVATGGANVSYTPAAAYCGPDSFTYQLTPGGSQATVTVNVLCPTAVNDAFTAFPFDTNPPGGGLTPVNGTFGDFRLDVLPNDINPPGSGPIKVASITQPTVNGVPKGSAAIIESGGAILLHSEGDDCQSVYVLTYALTPGGSQATVSTTIDCSSPSD
ncbi:MAG: hypothetical protein QOI10_3411 [Solirubrobacterales bacterium]|jgi:hypothetical protein|nr:hypothetical protein [Solirubrobacterales bacterium]